MKRLVYPVLLFVLVLGTFSAATAQETVWTQLPLGTGCPDWTRFDAHYYAGNGLVYIMGGRSGTSTVGTIYSLNPATNTCQSTGLTMPVPISNYTIVQVNFDGADQLCTFGGRPSAGGVTPEVQCFKPLANTVAVVTNLPGALAGFVPGGQVAVNNKVYVFGGFQNVQSPYETNVTYEWTPPNTWVQKGNLPLGMGYMQADAVDGKIYSFGGTVFDGTSLVAQAKAIVFDPATGVWDDASVAELPTAGAEGRAYGFDTASGYELAGKIVIAGGGQWPSETAEAFTYDVATNTYDYTFPNLNIQRRDHAGFFVAGVAESTPGAMWVLGGRSSATGYGGDNPPYAPPEWYEVGFGGCQAPYNVDFSWVPAHPYETDTVTFTGSADGTPPFNWSWSWGDGNLGAGNPATHTYATQGIYNVILTVSNNCGQASQQKQITVYPLWRVHLFRTKLNWAYTARPGWVKTVFAGIVRDDTNAAAPGVTTVGYWTLNGTPQPPASFVTTSLGQFKFPWKGPWASPGEYAFQVVDLQCTGCYYDVGANQAPDHRTVTVPSPP